MAEVLMPDEKLVNFINGRWKETENYRDVVNPANGKIITQVPLSTSTEVDEAVKAAQKAQKEWALVPAPQRAEVLYTVGSIMTAREGQPAQLLTIESGTVLDVARGEVQDGVGRASCWAREGG